MLPPTNPLPGRRGTGTIPHRSSRSATHERGTRVRARAREDRGSRPEPGRGARGGVGRLDGAAGRRRCSVADLRLSGSLSPVSRSKKWSSRVSPRRARPDRPTCTRDRALSRATKIERSDHCVCSSAAASVSRASSFVSSVSTGGASTRKWTSGIGSERFAEIDDCPQAASTLCRVWDEARILHALRPDPKHEWAPFVVGQ